MSVSPIGEDFLGDLKKPMTDELYGLKGKVKVVGMGHGVSRTIGTKAYYIPEGKIRLFGPQTYLFSREWRRK
jgi:hypothetical protein